MSAIDTNTVTCVVEDGAWLHLNYPHSSGGYTTGCLWGLELLAGTEEDAATLLSHNVEMVNSYGTMQARISALEAENERLRTELMQARFPGLSVNDPDLEAKT